MEITRVVVRPVDREKVKAVASVTFDDEFVVHNLRIVEGERGLFVAMPSRKLPSGEFRDVAHPVTMETREKIQIAVLREYERTCLPEETEVPEEVRETEEIKETEEAEEPEEIKEAEEPEES